MARKPSKAKQDQAITEPEVEPENVGQPEAATDNPAQPEATNEPPADAESTGSDKQAQIPDQQAGAKTKSGMIEAVLKTRHCRGGRCKEAGETMQMTRGEYERLKKYDRVE